MHASRLQGIDLLLLEQLAGLDDHLAGRRVLNIVAGGAAEHALPERHGHLAGLEDGARGDALARAAVLLGDDAVLRHVDQTPREVARVRRLQRGVGKALAGAVGRVEIFEHRQPLLEVGDDRRLDDLARRLGHQTAHTGKLLHLGGRTARTRMRHHIDGVDRLLPAGLGIALDRGDALHHLLGDELGALGPGVDHLVVFLAARDQAVIVLLLVLTHEVRRLLHDGVLGLRDHHVVLAERDAGAAGIDEAEPHDPVAEDDRLLLTAVAIDHVDHVGDVLLGEQPVDEIEAHLRPPRQQLAEQHAAGRGVVHLRHGLALGIDRDVAALDLGVQGHDLGVERMMDLGHVAESHALARLLVHGQRQVIDAEHDILRRHDDR